MKNKDSWTLMQEREQAMNRNRRDILGGHDVKKALYQVKNAREEMELNGIKPKNHINNQKDYIKKLEEKNKKNKELKVLKDEQVLFKLKRFQNAESFVKKMRQGDYSYLENQHHLCADHSQERHSGHNSNRYHEHSRHHHDNSSHNIAESSPNLLNMKNKQQNRNRSHSNNLKTVQDSRQDSVDRESFHEQQMSNQKLHKSKIKHQHTDSGSTLQKNFSLPDIHQRDSQTNSQFMDQQSNNNRVESQISKPQSNPSQKQQDNKRLLSDNEKQSIISELAQRRKDLFQQLNRMPIANVTRAGQDVKMQIENEIDQIENAIKMFSSRKPVYVSNDDNSFTH
eukprot:403366257